MVGSGPANFHFPILLPGLAILPVLPAPGVVLHAAKALYFTTDGLAKYLINHVLLEASICPLYVLAHCKFPHHIADFAPGVEICHFGLRFVLLGFILQPTLSLCITRYWFLLLVLHALQCRHFICCLWSVLQEFEVPCHLVWPH